MGSYDALRYYKGLERASRVHSYRKYGVRSNLAGSQASADRTGLLLAKVGGLVLVLLLDNDTSDLSLHIGRGTQMEILVTFAARQFDTPRVNYSKVICDITPSGSGCKP